MQKTRKRSETPAVPTYNTGRRYPVALPEIVTVDVLGTMLDEDLVIRLRVLEEDKGRVYESHMDSRPWEEELAYVRREQQIRRMRRDTHADYEREAQSEFARTEAGLPAGDFDNSAFVYAASGGRPRWN